MQSYITVKKLAEFEYEDRKSVFIGAAKPVSCESDAIAFIESVKKRYPDAKHHVYAYVLRENSIMRFSDDREPQGTAGMPVLDVIRKNSCTDTVIVVTRYFGGTLLGTGGLVRAYTAAALGALQRAEIIKYDIYSEISVSVGYSDYGKISPILSEFSVRVDSTDYAEEVTLLARIVRDELPELEKKLIEATSARVKMIVLGEKYGF